MYPITYSVDYYFTTGNTKEKQIEFLKTIAANQGSMTIFQSPYVKRFIDYLWVNKYRAKLLLNLVHFIFVFAILIVYNVLIHFPNDERKKKIREKILILNLVLVFIYLPYYEIK